MENESIIILSGLFGGGGLVSVMLKWITGQLTKAIEAVQESVKAVSLMQVELYKLFLAHDAQIRGINPTAGKDDQERHSEAAKNYYKLRESLESIELSIKNNGNK